VEDQEDQNVVLVSQEEESAFSAQSILIISIIRTSIVSTDMSQRQARLSQEDRQAFVPSIRDV